MVVSVLHNEVGIFFWNVTQSLWFLLAVMLFMLLSLTSISVPKYFNLVQTPQTPIVRTNAYTKFCIDEHPTGTNAIVAVLAYTG